MAALSWWCPCCLRPGGAALLSGFRAWPFLGWGRARWLLPTGSCEPAGACLISLLTHWHRELSAFAVLLFQNKNHSEEAARLESCSPPPTHSHTHFHTKPDLLRTGEWEGLKLRERFKVTGKEGPAVVGMERMKTQHSNALFSVFHIAKPRMAPSHQKI